MQALILAGGKGTRLRPLTVYTPKPIVPILNRPLLTYQLDLLARAGISDITLSLNYQPDKIEDLLGDGSDFGVNLRFVTEPSPMGTAGAYKFAAGAIRETTVVFNGDILTDVDIKDVVASHKSHKASATIVLVPVEDPSKFGLVETGKNSEVLRFLEKPSPELLAETKLNTINAGIYVLEPDLLDMIPESENRSFEYDVFPSIIKSGRRFFAHVLDGEYWRDLGTPESYLAAHMDFLGGKISKLKPAVETGTNDRATTAEVDRASIIGEGCVIKPHARIVNSVLGPGVHVDEKATISNSVIWAHTRVSTAAEIDGAIIGRSCYIGRNTSVGPGVHVDEKATISNSVIWAHTRVSTAAEIDGAIIGRSCYIGRNTSVGPGAVLGDKTTLPDYSRT